MANPLKVTFDKNTYEYVVCLDKDPSQMNSGEKKAYLQIQNAIKNRNIQPFISETILTLEAIDRRSRKITLSRPDRFVSSCNLENSTGTGFVSSVTFKPNPSLFPPSNDHFFKYLPLAIDLGFKILPNFRLGKIINPEIKSSWYHVVNGNSNLEMANNFSEVIKFIEKNGFGFSILKNKLMLDEFENMPWYSSLDKLDVNQKQFGNLVAEWSDADSIAIHIACGLKYFCTNDGARRDKVNSVLGKQMRTILKQKYDVEFVTPIELSKLIYFL